MQLLIIYSLGNANENCGMKSLYVPEAARHRAEWQAPFKQPQESHQGKQNIPIGAGSGDYSGLLFWG